MNTLLNRLLWTCTFPPKGLIPKGGLLGQRLYVFEFLVPVSSLLSRKVFGKKLPIAILIPTEV